VSETNVERLRRIYRALNARDADALVALCDPSIEIHSVFAAVGGAVYHGHDGVRKWQADLEDAWSGEFRSEVDSYFDLGDRTVAVGLLRGRGGQSGIEVAMPASAVAEWRDGRCAYFKAYADRDEALRSLGVSEDALEPIAP
jgi:ketosteroid isomerase-like protein